MDSLFQEGVYILQFGTISRVQQGIDDLNPPLLNKLLPGYCFFTTTFFSNYYEYMNVQLENL